MGYLFSCLVTVAMTAMLLLDANGETVQLVSSNVDLILGSHELVLVNFYADWCRFSNMLQPIYEDASKAVRQEFPEEGRVAFGKVDCDKETEIGKKYHVSKYPTLKLFRYGQILKKEYRGQRSVNSFSQFMREQLKDPIHYLNDLEETDNFDRKKRHIIGMFENDQSEDYMIFRKIASVFRDDCQFHSAVGPVSEEHRIAGNKVVYKPTGEDSQEMSYSGRLADYQTMVTWTTDKCIPLVKEITFENAEELTEEGLPFVILFHNPDDTETPEKYRKLIAQELLPEKNSVNFLTADGTKFSHPLYHLGKTAKDLPVLAIDSFKHMYIWKHDPKEDLEKAGLIKTFIADLHSGKLHREFHAGPDPSTAGNVAPGGMLANNVANAMAGANQIGGGANGEKAFHIDIQQQVITSPNGFKLNVIRLMQHEGAQHVDTVQALNQIDTDKVIQSDNGDDKKLDGDGNPVENPEQVANGDTKEPELVETQKNYEEHIPNDNVAPKEGGDAGSENEAVTVVEKTHKIKVEVDEKTLNDINRQKSNPPESIFNRLKPSEDRYSILHKGRDEL